MRQILRGRNRNVFLSGICKIHPHAKRTQEDIFPNSCTKHVQSNSYDVLSMSYRYLSSQSYHRHSFRQSCLIGSIYGKHQENPVVFLRLPYLQLHLQYDLRMYGYNQPMHLITKQSDLYVLVLAEVLHNHVYLELPHGRLLRPKNTNSKVYQISYAS